jgi:hypothetical protein
MMVFVYLHKRRILATTQVFGAIASLGERTPGRKMCDIGRKSGDLIQLGSFLVSGIRNALQ